MGEKRGQIGQRYAELPNKFTSPVNDPQLQAMSGQEMDKIKELYEHDKRLAERYANPQSEAYLQDPYAREKARATQSQATLGEIGDIQSRREQRKSTLEDALSRGLQLFLAGIQGLEKEADFLEKMLDKEEKKKSQKKTDILDILGKTGGAIPSDVLTELGLPAGLSIPSGGGKNRSTSVVDIGGRKVLIDDQTGATIKDLGLSGTSADQDTIDAYAASYLDGKILPNEIPAEIRGQVLKRAEEFRRQSEQQTQQGSQKPQAGKKAVDVGQGLLFDILDKLGGKK